jgi:hypothetical protein
MMREKIDDGGPMFPHLVERRIASRPVHGAGTPTHDARVRRNG